jgi:hypothetical protein
VSLSLRFTIPVIAVCLGLAACTGTPHPEGKPVAEQTFDHFETVPLQVYESSIERSYDPSLDQEDISTQLILPPQVAIMEYAQKRFGAAGGTDRFRFVLEDASVTKRTLQQSNETLRWMGLGAEEEYRFHILISLQRVSPGAYSGPGAEIKLDRTLIIPESASIAEREAKQNAFVEKLVRDLDAMVLETLQHSMKLY